MLRRRKLPAGSKVPKEKTLSALKKDLQDVFNRYIRLRDTLYSRGQAYFVCVSCGHPKALDQMNAGHFHPVGGNDVLRYDERNVHGQCIHCNKFKHGNHEGYLKFMLRKYGQKVVDELEIRRHNRSNLMRFEVALLKEVYTKKIKEIQGK